MEENRELAIEVCQVNFQYGGLLPGWCPSFLSPPTPVLNQINMCLPKGKIYGLLGASGCGKTTLLRCCLGRLNPSSGIINVLGKPPLSPGHEIPGRMVGYMPQELALYGNFTPIETLRYFGMLCGISQSEVTKRARFLISLLKLPTEQRLIKKLSGGQQRRVSFCVALLHTPPLLILDEPTVGVDPLLRSEIWKHLLELSSKGTSIVITTHYIEEAKQAHIVGLMRSGRLLAEREPQYLCDFYKCPTLEEVFLQLCHHQERAEAINGRGAINTAQNGKPAAEDTDKPFAIVHRGTNNNNNLSNEETPLLNSGINGQQLTYEPKHHGAKIGMGLKLWRLFTPGLPLPRNILALFVKNFLKFMRNFGLLLFQFCIPSVQIILFCFAIGKTPYGLPIAICNEDRPALFYPNLAKLFLQQLDNNSFELIHKPSYEEARHEVQIGAAWAVLHFGENFTLDTINRFRDQNGPVNISNATLKGSLVDVALDMSNFQIAATIQAELLQTYQKFLVEMIERAGLGNPKVVESPVHFLEPVYGESSPTFTEFVAPGMLITISFGISVGLTAISLIVEKKEGLLDRGWVAGVGVVEMVTAHLLLNSVVLLVQITMMISFALFVFQIPYHGSLLLIWLLIFLEGFSGMSFGLLISAMVSEEIAGLQIATGILYPIILLSGIIWPLEAVPFWLRDLSYSFPTTLTANALRSIITRGWGLQHEQVWEGFVIIIGWIAFFIIFAVIGLKFKK